MKRSKAKRGRAARAPSLVYSTSEARANFAEALEMAAKDRAVIGFERYGRTVAALAPVEAIYLLAGRGAEVDAHTRAKIARAAENLVQDVLQSQVAEENALLAQRPSSRAKRAGKQRKPKDA